MLYNPAFDLYHCVYRFMIMISKIENNAEMEVDRLRIYDFLILFPYKIKRIRIKNDEKELKRLVKDLKVDGENPYNHIPNDKMIFDKLKSYQMSALNYIASYGIIDSELLLNNRIRLKDEKKMIDILCHLEIENDEKNYLLDWLFSNFNSIPFMGKNGLKDRTKLMEWKYDIA